MQAEAIRNLTPVDREIAIVLHNNTPSFGIKIFERRDGGFTFDVLKFAVEDGTAAAEAANAMSDVVEICSMSHSKAVDSCRKEKHD